VAGRSVVNDALAREPIAIVVRPGDEEPWAVFSRHWTTGSPGWT
jgi:hypothetical protein